MNFDLAELEGEARGFAFKVTDSGGRLPDIPCRLVKLENWDTINGNPAVPNDKTVYWGYSGSVQHRLAPGGTSELLPVSKLSDIYVVVLPNAGGAACTLYVSVYF